MYSQNEIIHGVPAYQTYFHVYKPQWRSKWQGETDWSESNLLDRFIDILRTKPQTRKELGYIALKNGYPRVIVTQCLDLLPILEYIGLMDDTYLYLLPPEIKPEDIW
jgi:hypothetical protein